MYTTYKHFMILYDIVDGKIVVKSIIANGNYQCMYGTRTYDSLEDLKRDIDNKRYG